MKQKVKIGLFGIGLETYWPHFEGLLCRLTVYQQELYWKSPKPTTVTAFLLAFVRLSTNGQKLGHPIIALSV
ncbi:MAG: hypothetical protein VB024_10570 [Dysgonamonadaceae bacterium]|nr:hypothetical protein [Dysgonamonadaceae bacterium]MDD3309598.1 hypothetical protein [Dysgonamonadaceae bacterium]MDD3900294.1 hypothetical protein [Dysgonamonadaceae bacterium]MDD4398850.1 hypothetical protein [Dysgonamonadaceae bacterium]MEA5082050.1 hypothetical protein [Dysgonamonadaceae bacterium]